MILRYMLIICFMIIYITTRLFGQQQDASRPDTEGKVKVFITDSKSWEVSGGFGGSGGAFGGASGGGARLQTAEIIKTFGQRCPSVTVTMKQEKAEFIVLLDHEGGKGLGGRDNKVVVFNKDGDAIFSHSTRSLGNAVKEACTAMQKPSSSK